MIALLVWLVVVCVVIWAARSLMAAFGIGDPIATVVYVLLVLILLVGVLNHLGVVGLPGVKL